MPKPTMSQPKKYKLIVEKDVAVPLRDGSIIARMCSGLTAAMKSARSC